MARAGSGLTGECLMRDAIGAVEKVQIDLGGNPALRAALDSTPRPRAPASGGPPALAVAVAR